MNATVAGPTKAGLIFHRPSKAYLSKVDLHCSNHQPFTVSAWTSLHQCPSPASLHVPPRRSPTRRHRTTGKPLPPPVAPPCAVQASAVTDRTFSCRADLRGRCATRRPPPTDSAATCTRRLAGLNRRLHTPAASRRPPLPLQACTRWPPPPPAALHRSDAHASYPAATCCLQRRSAVPLRPRRPAAETSPPRPPPSLAAAATTHSRRHEPYSA